jgi:hypothetical protein
MGAMDDSELIRFTCACGRRMKAEPKYLGRVATCPKCGTSVIVSRPVAASPAPPPIPPPLPPPIVVRALAASAPAARPTQAQKTVRILKRSAIRNVPAVLCLVGLCLFLSYRLMEMLTASNPVETKGATVLAEPEIVLTDPDEASAEEELSPEQAADVIAVGFAIGLLEKTANRFGPVQTDFQRPVIRRHSLGDLRWIWHIEGTLDATMPKSGIRSRFPYEIVVNANIKGERLRMLYYKFDNAEPVEMPDWPALRDALPSPRSWERID